MSLTPEQQSNEESKCREYMDAHKETIVGSFARAWTLHGYLARAERAALKEAGNE